MLHIQTKGIVMKKLHKFALTAGATIATLASLNSCKSREQKEADAEQARMERLLAEERAEEERKITEYKVYENARDSVLDARGYQADAYNRQCRAESELARLSSLTQRDVLRENVYALINVHARQCADEILNLLNKYGLHIKDRWGKKSEQDVLIDYAREEYLWDYAPNRTSAKRDGIDSSEKAELLKAVIPGGMFADVDWREYGESRQQEVKNAVLKIFDKMNHELDASLRAEVKKFAVYYPILDISKSGVPAEYAKLYADYDPIDFDEERGFNFEYGPTDLIVTRNVDVYDSKLDVDFFGQEGAKYQLVKVAQGKWQVIRTDKDGKVAKTPVFSHNVDYKYDMYGTGNYFGFEPGANMGVHVYATEQMWQKSTIRDDKYVDLDGKIAAKCDSLTVEVARLRELNKRMKEISHAADSIAKVKQQEYIKKTR